MLNPTWLTTFVTLVDTGHFTQTAEKLMMTQPGVSQHINKLEQACGQRLIARDKKRFDITEQGRLVYQYALSQVSQHQALLAQLSADEPYNGECVLGCSGALSLLLYPALIQLQMRHQSLIMKLKAAPNGQVLDEIQQDKLDVGIVTEQPKPGLYEVETIGQEHLCLVFAKRRQLSRVDSELLTQVGLIDHPDAKHYLAIYFAKCQHQDLASVEINDIPVTGFVNQISQILHPVTKDLGFTVMPKSAVDSFSAPEQLQVFEPQQSVVETLYLVSKRNRQLPARVKTVIADVKTVLS